MGSEHKGHVFDFDYDRCKRCGMTKTQWENAGEPPCTGERVRSQDAQSEQPRRVREDDF